MEHSLGEYVTLKENSMDIEFLCGLLEEPRSIQLSLNVFTLKQVSKNQLIFSKTPSVKNQIQRPFDFVVETKHVYAFHHLRRCEDLELLLRLVLLISLFLCILEGKQLLH